MALHASSFGIDGAQTKDLAVDTRVCDCCPIAAASTDHGVIVTFRDRSEDEIRDIAVSHLTDAGWSPPAPVARDGWQIRGCPVNGPSLDARDLAVVVGWFTAPEGAGLAYVAFSSDGGRTFAPPIRLDDGAALGRVQVVLLDDGVAAGTWVEQTEHGAEFRVRRVAPDAVRSPSAVVAAIGGGQHPQMARHGDSLLFAWTESHEGSPMVMTATAPASVTP
jgi:hypothetical protein